MTPDAQKEDRMKLSEAILLGSTILTPKAGGQHFAENQAGCALGMAAIARGCNFHRVSRPFPSKDRRTLGTEGVWGDWVLQIVMRPCLCWLFRVPHEMRIKDIVAHIFDYHVMQKQDWTLDQLAAWVETVEPKKGASRGALDPEPFERISGFPTVRQRQIVNESEEDRIAANEWQVRVSAFTAKHGSGRESGQRRRRRSTL
jgi:hypothetical protein